MQQVKSKTTEQKNNLKPIYQWITLGNRLMEPLSLGEFFFDVVQQRMQHRRIALLQRAEPLVQPVAQFLVIADIQCVQQGIGAAP